MSRSVLAAAFAVAAITSSACGRASAAPATPTVPDPAIDRVAGPALRTAVFAGGCFWGVDAVFKHVKGVARVVSGYAGGEASTAHYEQVGSGDTGHAESVQVTYDPAAVSYGTLLKVFFSVAHDPTEKNRQGPDVGPQYRSAIFVADASEREAAVAYIAQLDAAHTFARPIVTTIEPLRAFYAAEDYHQNYLAEHPDQPYIVYNDMPKLAALKTRWPALYTEVPTTTAAARN